VASGEVKATRHVTELKSALRAFVPNDATNDYAIVEEEEERRKGGEEVEEDVNEEREGRVRRRKRYRRRWRNGGR